MNYIDLPDNKFKFETNNKVELFNKRLNSTIGYIRTKSSLFYRKI